MLRKLLAAFICMSVCAVLTVGISGCKKPAAKVDEHEAEEHKHEAEDKKEMGKEKEPKVDPMPIEKKPVDLPPDVKKVEEKKEVDPLPPEVKKEEKKVDEKKDVDPLPPEVKKVEEKKVIDPLPPEVKKEEKKVEEKKDEEKKSDSSALFLRNQYAFVELHQPRVAVLEIYAIRNS